MKFSKLLEKIYPQPAIGGLEINDSVIRLVQFKGNTPLVRAYELPQGVVGGGELKDKARLMPLLKELARVSGGKRKPALVLTVSSNTVFVQTFNLPAMARENLEEAAELNARMISPLKQGEFYYGWQKISEDEPGKPIRLLAAFASHKIVNDFVYSLEEAGFSLVSVEFTSLSLIRELKRKGAIEPRKPYLVVEIRPEGMTFILAFGDQLLFHSFEDWGNIAEGGKIKTEEFLTVLARGVNNVSGFYTAHWGGLVNDLIFINLSLGDGIKERFKDKTVTLFTAEEAMPALGAAIRPMLEDGEKQINLLGTSSSDVFRQNRALAFVALWRNILAATFGFLLLLSLGADIFLRQLNLKTTEVNAFTLNEPAHQELSGLKDKASRFNQLTVLFKEVKQRESKIGGVAELVNNLAGTEIKISRFYIPSPDAPISVSGSALNEQAAIAFKNRLANEKSFTGVELPLSTITPETGGRVSFVISLRAGKP
ncbi:MAG: hypothetical protein HYW00_01660 [Candidatus Colwellbacteria bacterium]|nr:hypothetical protein [Candidatus Colwellbacteria bacterium]